MNGNNIAIILGEGLAVISMIETTLLSASATLLISGIKRVLSRGREEWLLFGHAQWSRHPNANYPHWEPVHLESLKNYATRLHVRERLGTGFQLVRAAAQRETLNGTAAYCTQCRGGLLVAPCTTVMDSYL